MLNNEENLLNDEEEDVVIAGSELDEALSKMGYTDYEIVPLINDKPLTDKADDKPALKDSFSQRLKEKASQIYRYLTKDSRAVKAQLVLISEAEHLLDDHSALIKSLLEENGQTQLRRTEKFLTYLRYAAGASAFFCFVNRPNSVTSLLVLPALITVRRKYKNYRMNRDLKKLIHEQTELHYNYKKIFRILKQFFGVKRGVKQSGITKFVDLTEEKLKFLQPITEKTLKSLQALSAIYYQTTLILANILSNNYKRIIDPQITRFDAADFLNCGEINYETLKQLFYRFILIQSEMLVTLAVFSISEPRSIFDEIKRTFVAENRIGILVESTKKYRLLIGKIVNDFHNYKSAVVEHKYRGFRGSKWQDLYVRLYLTSHKIQNAYNKLSSVLEEIEDHLDRGTDEAELLQRLKISLDEVYGDADKARDLAQLSGLIVLKMERANFGKEEKDSELDDEVSGENSRLDILPVIRNSDPEIVDEVFEEYIRERYSDRLFNEEEDDYFETCNNKLDRLLSKNLMSELKEALVDKERDTKERESRALERMGNKNAIEIAADDQKKEKLSSDSKADIELKTSHYLSENYPEETDMRKLYPVPIPPPMPMKRDLNQQREKEKYESTVEKENEIFHEKSNCFIPLKNSFPVQKPFFLYNSEETFIGSGENSEEEIIDVDDESLKLDTE